MATVIVTTDGGDELLRESVHPVHLEDEHSSLQVIERIAWAVDDAEHQRSPRRSRSLAAAAYTEVPIG